MKNWFKKKAVTISGKYSFPVYDLTPTDAAEGIECYAYMLEKALERKEVTNIAVAGRYGSGKSSFLNTFFKSRDNGKVLKISMAAFLEKDGGQKMDESRERLLEISILQQMFYHVTQKELPFSRFRRLTKLGWGTWWSMLTYVALIMATAIFLSQPASMVRRFPEQYVLKWSGGAYWVGAMAFCAVVAIGIFHLLRFYKKIKHCNLNFQNIELDIEKEDETSVFNRYMDEVVYFFEETGYSTVLFEDIDRFKDHQIFTKLRELNLILNRAKQIRQKPIRFIYALRDNVFTGTERVKFFDFILPIVPVVDSKSSAAKLTEMLTAYVGEDKISEYREMIHAIAPYISDMRLMNNIVNEFAAYREMISTQGNGVRFLGMVIFKNFFPAEFAKLYERTDSLLVRVLQRKKTLAKERISQIEKLVDEVKAAIALSEKEMFRSVKELQGLYMTCCIGGVLPECATTIGWQGQEEIRLSEFFATPELFDSLCGKDFSINWMRCDPYYGTRNQACTYKWADVYPKVRNDLGEYNDRVKAIKDKVASRKSRYYSRITELMAEESSVARLSLSDMFKRGWLGENDLRAALKDGNAQVMVKNGDAAPDVEVRQETVLLLYQLLYDGYVGENYEHFISVFKTGDMTRDDNDFETAVLENVEHEFDHKIDDPTAVADHLGIGMFTKSAVRNLSLIETMIKSRDRFKDKLEAFASQFAKNTADNRRFAIELMLRAYADADCATKVIGFYVEHWNTCVDDLFKEGNLVDDKKTKLAEACLRWVRLSNGMLPAEVGSFIARALHPCELFRRAGYFPDQMVKLLDESNVRLENCVFESEEERQFVEAVRRSGCYLYGEGMLERLMAASGSDTHDFDKAPMSCVLKSGLQDIVSDVNDNFGYFVESLYSGKTEREDDKEVVINVLNTPTFDVEGRETFAKVQKRQIEDLSELKDDAIAKRLLTANMVVASWKNVVYAAERLEYGIEAQEFLDRNRDILVGHDCREVEDPLRKWIDWLVVTESVTVDALKSTLDLFPASITIQALTKVDVPAERIRVGAESGRIRFTPALYEQLKKAGKDGHVELAEAYPKEFIQACRDNEWKMTHKDLVRIFTGERFSEVQKLEVLNSYEKEVADLTVAKAASSFLSKTNYKKVSETVLEAVFPYLTQSDLQVVILLRLNPDAAVVKDMLSKMREPYNAVLDAEDRKKLSSTAINRSFIRFLREKGLVEDVKPVSSESTKKGA